MQYLSNLHSVFGGAVVDDIVRNEHSGAIDCICLISIDQSNYFQVCAHCDGGTGHPPCHLPCSDAQYFRGELSQNGPEIVGSE